MQHYDPIPNYIPRRLSPPDREPWVQSRQAAGVLLTLIAVAVCAVLLWALP